MKNDLKYIKNSGFKTPDNYFENLDDTILGHAKLNQHFPEKDAGFTIPEHYFNALENDISNRLNTKNASGNKVISLFSKKNLIYISGVAAAVLIMFNIFSSKQDVTFDTIELDLVENYLSTQEISHDELLSLLTNDIQSEDTFIQDNLSEEYIENIILEEDIYFDEFYE